MRKSSKTKKSLASAGLVALVGGALLIPSASAGREDGRFFIHAWNTDDPQFRATAGLQGLGVGDGGAGEVPSDEDTSAVLADFSCGPFDLKLTQAMVDLSEKNSKSEGAPQKHQQGWTSIYHLDLSTYSSYLSGPGSLDEPTIYLNFNNAPRDFDPYNPSPDFASTFTARKTPEGCDLSKDSLSTRTDQSYGYAISKSLGQKSYTETRNMGSKTVNLTRFFDGTSGKFLKTDVIYSANDFSVPLVSETEPYSFVISPESTSLQLRLPSAKDGYDGVSILEASDRTLIDYKLGYRDADRAHGPTSLQLDSTGKIVSISYMKNGSRVTITDWLGSTPITRESFNSASGKDWDGSYPRSKDYNLSLPFEPLRSAQDLDPSEIEPTNR